MGVIPLFLSFLVLCSLEFRSQILSRLICKPELYPIPGGICFPMDVSQLTASDVLQVEKTKNKPFLF